MSLSVAALQLATIKALEGAVSAKVFGSVIDPLQLQNEPEPIIVVAMAEGRLKLDSRELLMADHNVDLVLDFGVARQVTRTVADGQSTVSFEFADKDIGHDLILQTLGYEVYRALSADEGWAELWRELIAGGSEEASIWERGASAENGVRLAIIRNVLRLKLMNEPEPGADPNDLWTRILAAMAADDELKDLAAIWRDAISKPVRPGYLRDAAMFGYTDAEIAALGDGPAAIDAGNSADPTTLEIPLEQEVRISDEAGATAIHADGATSTPADGESAAIAR